MAATAIVDVEPVGEIDTEGDVDAARGTGPLNATVEPSRTVMVTVSGVGLGGGGEGGGGGGGGGDGGGGGVGIPPRSLSPVSRSAILAATSVLDADAASVRISMRGTNNRIPVTDAMTILCACIQLSVNE